MQSSESSSSVPHDFELEPHGLFVLYPTPEVYVEPSALEVEYVKSFERRAPRAFMTYADLSVLWLSTA